MESQGKMLVALSLIAVLSGLSAISYVAVQQNANVLTQAAPSAPGSASTTTATGRLPTCTTNQDCIDFAIAQGMCKAGVACSPGGGSFDCVAGTCTVVGVSATASGGAGGAGGASLSGLAATTPATTPNASTNPGTDTGTGATCGTKSSGDFDCNGKVECADLTLFVSEFTGKVSTKTSDVTNDNKVSLADFEKGRVGAAGAWASCQL